jgi:hypothetical protein
MTAKHQHLIAKITMAAGFGAVAAAGIAPVVAVATPAVAAGAAVQAAPDSWYHA